MKRTRNLAYVGALCLLIPSLSAATAFAAPAVATMVAPTGVQYALTSWGGSGSGGSGGTSESPTLGPSTALGVSHLDMYRLVDANCTRCHGVGNIGSPPPTISVNNADMRQGVACSSCHAPGKRQSTLFISLMNNPTKIVYNRCSDCHTIAGSGSGGGGSWGR
jgi:hypothetical protein